VLVGLLGEPRPGVVVVVDVDVEVPASMLLRNGLLALLWLSVPFVSETGGIKT
jgi:hypothetical protein